jgi:hypothetical protein
VTKEKEKSAVPPYVSYKTFHNFLDGLNPVPSVIDSHVLKTMSGALKAQLLSSLRYLELIDEKNKSQPNLRTLASAKGEDRKKELDKLITNSYPFLFAEAGDFSLAEGTYPQLMGKFQNEGATGETAKRCVRFFLDAAKDAGIIISPYIQSEPVTKTKSDGSKSTRERSAPKRKNSPEEETPGGGVIPQTEWQIKLKTALDLLPSNFDKNGKAHWTKPSRDSFYAVITAIVDAYAMVDDKPAT